MEDGRDFVISHLITSHIISFIARIFEREGALVRSCGWLVGLTFKDCRLGQGAHSQLSMRTVVVEVRQ